MFQDSKCQFVELVDQIDGRVDIKQVVVRDFLTVQLVEHIVEFAIEFSCLVRVFTVTQVHRLVYRSPEMRTLTAIEIIEDCRIIARRNGKCFFGKPFTVFDRSFCTFFVQQLHQRLILSLRCYDHHIFEVFCSGTDKRNAAYIYLFDNCLFFRTGSNCFLERIQVDNHQVYFRNFILGDLSLVTFIITTVQNTTEHFRMKRLHTSAQDRRIAGQVLYRITRESQLFYKLLSTTRRHKTNTFAVELLQNFI